MTPVLPPKFAQARKEAIPQPAAKKILPTAKENTPQPLAKKSLPAAKTSTPQPVPKKISPPAPTSSRMSTTPSQLAAKGMSASEVPYEQAKTSGKIYPVEYYRS